MSQTCSYPIKPARQHRAAVRLGLTLLLGLGMTQVAGAQAAASAVPSRTQPGQEMHRFGPLEGPPFPAFMKDSLQVTGKALDRYTDRYQRYMAETKALRDSIRTNDEALRNAKQKGDTSLVQSQRKVLDREWKLLDRKDQRFEDSLKNVLTKDQLTRFQQFESRERHEARAERVQDRRADWKEKHEAQGKVHAAANRSR
jgi:predicted nucleic acid-binding protein